MFEESPRVVHSLGILDVGFPRPGDEIKIISVLFNKERIFFEILETSPHIG